MHVLWIIAGAVLIAATPSQSRSKPTNFLNVDPAPSCTDEERENCKLPDCRCSGTDIPGNFTPSETPQIVYLTYDDAVTWVNIDFYAELFKNRKNPNGHAITGTFYISHEYTNYSAVHDLWARGHEVALHSITHSSLTTYWKNLNVTMWEREVVDQREQMAYFANIPQQDIKGFRAPFLQTGGDNMYQVLSDGGFQYECSRPTLMQRKPGLWPYTNDYLSSQDCEILPCPIGSYPGFWTVPMLDMIGDNGEGCSMVDTCTPVPQTQKEMYDLLIRNFNDQYNGNRAPFGVFVHAGYFNGSSEGDEVAQRRRGYEQFIDHILTLGDVYIVSVTRAVEWVKTPQNVNQTRDFAPFKVVEKPRDCALRTCAYKADQTPFPSERYMYSCKPCTPKYPWLKNHMGEDKPY